VFCSYGLLFRKLRRCRTLKNKFLYLNCCQIWVCKVPCHHYTALLSQCRVPKSWSSWFCLYSNLTWWPAIEPMLRLENPHAFLSKKIVQPSLNFGSGMSSKANLAISSTHSFTHCLWTWIICFPGVLCYQTKCRSACIHGILLKGFYCGRQDVKLHLLPIWLANWIGRSWNRCLHANESNWLYCVRCAKKYKIRRH